MNKQPCLDHVFLMTKSPLLDEMNDSASNRRCSFRSLIVRVLVVRNSIVPYKKNQNPDNIKLRDNLLCGSYNVWCGIEHVLFEARYLVAILEQ